MLAAFYIYSENAASRGLVSLKLINAFLKMLSIEKIVYRVVPIHDFFRKKKMLLYSGTIREIEDFISPPPFMHLTSRLLLSSPSPSMTIYCEGKVVEVAVHPRRF